jgi:hypothetical protein
MLELKYSIFESNMTQVVNEVVNYELFSIGYNYKKTNNWKWFLFD